MANQSTGLFEMLRKAGSDGDVDLLCKGSRAFAEAL